MRPIWTSVLICLAALATIGCGGSQPATVPPAPTEDLNPSSASNISVSIDPQSAELDTTLQFPSTAQFNASVTNANDTRVEWRVNGIPGGNAELGTVSTTGLYTAPLDVPPVSIAITAVSRANPSRSATATVALHWAAEVAVLAPQGTAVPLNGEIPMDAAVMTRAPDKGVDWSVNGVQNGNGEFGSITGDGQSHAHYQAPAVKPNSPLRVLATARANPSRHGHLTPILLTPDFVVLPTAATVQAGGQLQLEALRSGIAVPARWVLSGISNATSDSGSIIDGLYTAPTEVAAMTIVSAVAFDGDQFATAQIMLLPSSGTSTQCPTGKYVLSFSNLDLTFLGLVSFEAEGRVRGIGDLVERGYDEQTVQQASNQEFSGAYECASYGKTIIHTRLRPATFYLISADPEPKSYTLSDYELTIGAEFVNESFAHVYVSGDGVSARGKLEKQVAMPFSEEAIAGAYVFSLQGGYTRKCLGFCIGDGYPITILGTLGLDSAGAIGGRAEFIQPTCRRSPLDGQCYPTDPTQMRGALDGSTLQIDSAGRGYALLQLPNVVNGMSRSFSVVAVSPERWYLMYAAGGATLVTGVAERRDPAAAPTDGGAYVFSVGGFTGRLVAESPGLFTGAVYDCSGENLELSSSYSLEEDGRAAGTVIISGQEPAEMVVYFIDPQSFLIAWNGNFGKAEAQSGLPFAQSSVVGDYVLTGYQGGHGSFSRSFQEDAFGYLELEGEATYFRIAFAAADPDGKGTALFTRAGESTTNEEVRYYAVSPSKLLFHSFRGMAEKRRW